MSWHAKMSASSAHRWLACAGSVQLSERIPEDDTSLPAAIGTAAHQLAEECLHTGHSPARYLGKHYQVGPYDIEVDDDMVYGTSMYVKYCRLLTGSNDVSWIEMDVTEQMTRLDEWFGGTADYVTYDPDIQHLAVVDYKNGSGVFVPAEHNPQLMYYALGALMVLEEAGHEVEHISVHVVQPNFGDEEPIREWQFTPEDLVPFQQEIQQAARDARKDTPPLNAGEHCRFCPAKLHCPQLESHTQLVQSSEFDILPVLSEMQLGRAMSILDAVEARCKAIRGEAYKRMMRGDEIPGQKLVAKQARRRWTDEAELKARVAEDPEVDTDQLFQEAKVKSVAQLEKVIGKKRFQEVYSDLTESKSSGYTVVPIGDDRAPVTPGKASEDDFDIL